MVAVTINHEQMDAEATRQATKEIEAMTGLPATDVLLDGPGRLAEVIRAELRKRAGS